MKVPSRPELDLPRLAGESSDDSLLDETLNPEAGQEETVLVVEDDEKVRAYQRAVAANVPIAPITPVPAKV